MWGGSFAYYTWRDPVCCEGMALVNADYSPRQIFSAYRDYPKGQ